MIHISIKEKVEKKLKKFDLETRQRINKEIENLKENIMPKNPKHILATDKNSFLCEKSFDKIRIYYYFTFGEITIFDIKYEGHGTIFKINKKSGRQQKEIDNMKKNFKKKNL